jgi:DNA-binding transcriptional LysR family regulator
MSGGEPASPGSMLLRMQTWAERIGRRVKLRDLHILMEVVQSGSMVRAAKHLGISTPVVSKTIADIEHALGVPLLDRLPHGVEPTLYGRALIKRSIVVFDELRQSVRDIEFLADPTVGEARIGSTEPLAAGIVPAVIERLNRRHPRILFHVVQADFATMLRELRAREIDLMIGRPPESISEDDLDSQVLFNDRPVFIAGVRNRLSRRRKIDLAELIDEPWSLPPVGSIPRSAIIAAFRAAGVDAPRAIVSTAATQLHTCLLATGRFITTLPESVIHFGGKHLCIKVLPVKIPEVQLSPVLIITLKNRTPNPATQLVIDCAIELAQPLARSRSRVGRN